MLPKYSLFSLSPLLLSHLSCLNSVGSPFSNMRYNIFICEFIFHYTCIDAPCKGLCKGDLVVNGYLHLFVSSFSQIYKGLCRSFYFAHLLLYFVDFSQLFCRSKGLEEGLPGQAPILHFIFKIHSFIQSFILYFAFSLIFLSLF